MPNTVDLAPQIEAHARTFKALTDVVEQVVVGQRYMVERLFIGLLCNGHVLLEGVPGLAKTLTVSTLAGAIHAKFSRIQFTPDLLPADLVGTLIYNPRDATFTPRKGPVFANIVLADEINRAPAKVQSALLESMQERHVTIGDVTYPLPDPFLVLATQNPIEQEGTYTLPEAQIDRFMLKLRIGYPTREDERKIVDRMASSAPKTRVEASVTTDEIAAARRLVDQIYVDDRVKDYIVSIVHATRRPKEFGLDIARLIAFSISLTMAARAHAFMEGRPYVSPSDVKAIGMDVLRHRVITSYEAQAEDVTSEDVVRKVFDHVPLP